jgi:ABC-type transport system involved in multi-copper enzyme maturation permease subunit
MAPSWWDGFLAVVRYEILWNLRKKKFLGMLILAIALVTLSLFLPFLVGGLIGQEPEPNPDFALSAVAGVGGLGFFLFGLVTAINSVSSEFEEGTIIPLLSKPISRSTVFLGKLTGAILTIMATYAVLVAYQVIGGTLVHGPQNNLHLAPLFYFGMILSTLVWVAIVLAFGSASKNTTLTALAAVGIFMGLGIVGGIFSVFTGEGWVLSYIPGGGTSGFIAQGNVTSPYDPRAITVSTGTDSLGTNIVQYILRPSVEVTFWAPRIQGQPGQMPGFEILYTMPMGLVLLQTLAVVLAYIIVFSVIAWLALRRAEVKG